MAVGSMLLAVDGLAMAGFRPRNLVIPTCGWFTSHPIRVSDAHPEPPSADMVATALERSRVAQRD